MVVNKTVSILPEKMSQSCYKGTLSVYPDRLSVLMSFIVFALLKANIQL